VEDVKRYLCTFEVRPFLFWGREWVRLLLDERLSFFLSFSNCLRLGRAEITMTVFLPSLFPSGDDLPYTAFGCLSPTMNRLPLTTTSPSFLLVSPLTFFRPLSLLNGNNASLLSPLAVGSLTLLSFFFLFSSRKAVKLLLHFIPFLFLFDSLYLQVLSRNSFLYRFFGFETTPASFLLPSHVKAHVFLICRPPPFGTLPSPFLRFGPGHSSTFECP